MKENIDNTNPIDLESDNKKLTFDSNLDPEINSEYINHWNDNFIRDPDFWCSNYLFLNWWQLKAYF